MSIGATIKTVPANQCQGTIETVPCIANQDTFGFRPFRTAGLFLCWDILVFHGRKRKTFQWCGNFGNNIPNFGELIDGRQGSKAEKADATDGAEGYG